MATHFNVGDTLHLQGLTMSSNTTSDVVILEIKSRRPYTYLIEETTDEHLSSMAKSLRHTSGVYVSKRKETETNLIERLMRSWTTSNKAMEELAIVEKRRRAKREKKQKVGIPINPDEEYWNYIRTYGSDDEKELAADYFDVSPSAFDYSYREGLNLD